MTPDADAHIVAHQGEVKAAIRQLPDLDLLDLYQHPPRADDSDQHDACGCERCIERLHGVRYFAGSPPC